MMVQDACAWCLFTCSCYELVCSLHSQKKQVSPPSLVIMGLETIDGSHVAFQGKEMGPPAHWLEEKSSGTSIMEMQNTQWCGSTMGGHFIHSVPLSPFQGVGEHEETANQEEDRGVMWESSALLLGPDSCWHSLHSLTLIRATDSSLWIV